MDKSIRDIIAANISGLRKASKMTQADLADRLFYTDKAVSKWERGESLPDAEMLYQIAQIFNVEIQYLFQEHNYVNLSDDEEKQISKRRIFYKVVYVFSIVIISFTMLLSVLSSFAYMLEVKTLYIALFFVPLIPISMLIVNLIAGRKRFNKTLISLAIWTLGEAFYVYFYKFHVIYIFAICIVIQIGIILWPRFNSYIDRPKKKKNKKEDKE
ncbi:MAG: helix-turn-helix transcriptional regulator [Erysipelotrichaceae bacterium]|nr:helix-turn-helix transcriptional regulator [Erysipelotrichaceae bacterium]